MLYQELLEKLTFFKIPIALSLVGVVLILGGIFLSPQQPKKEFPQGSLIDANKEIAVDISGAVNKPGVYKLASNARVDEAIKAAEGLSPKASQEYVSKYLNLAQKLVDGAKIYIPLEGESSPHSTTVVGVAGASSGQVNLNTSSQSELEALPGIGPVTASKIISGRPYQKIEELLERKVLSKGVFEKIKDSLTVY